MKIAPKIFTKKALLNKINNRTQERIEQFITVSPSLNSKRTKQIFDNADFLSRYAKRQNCHLEFSPAGDVFQSALNMKVSRDKEKVITDVIGIPAAIFHEKAPIGNAILPYKHSDRCFIESVKTAIKEILALEKNV